MRSNHNSQPLALNQTLNDLAQSWADTVLREGKLVASPGKRSYSENIFRVSGGGNVSNTDAVIGAAKSWFSSHSWYNFTNPKPAGFSQMVWNATTQLGIGVAAGNDSSVVVATYYPRGNVISVGSKADAYYFFKKNVFPEIPNPQPVYPAAATNSSSST